MCFHPSPEATAEVTSLLAAGDRPAEVGALLDRHQPAPSLSGVQLAARCASASTWTLVVAGPALASDTVFPYGVPYGM